MNFAQVVFARTFNVLYQQKVTDINTMFKVFRRDCLDGVHLLGNGFNFDIELVCKIVRNGYDPLEVPVNYVARELRGGEEDQLPVGRLPFVLSALPVSLWPDLRSTPATITGATTRSTSTPTTSRR